MEGGDEDMKNWAATRTGIHLLGHIISMEMQWRRLTAAQKRLLADPTDRWHPAPWAALVKQKLATDEPSRRLTELGRIVLDNHFRLEHTTPPLRARSVVDVELPP
jgi:hypothetical protein